jgi:hypothetical protein
MMKLAALIFVSLLPLSCAIENESASRIEEMPITKVQLAETAAAGNEVTFVATVQTPNPCWVFHHFDIQQDQQEIKVKAYAEYQNRPCQQVVDSFEATGTVTLNEAGTYTFKFSQGEEWALEKEVVVE